MKVDPDKLLVEKAQSGDKRAFDELVLKYQERIYELVYRFTKNPDDASDLSQDVFLKAYDSINEFNGNSAFYKWLYRIALNVGHIYQKARPTKRLMWNFNPN